VVVPLKNWLVGKGTGGREKQKTKRKLELRQTRGARPRKTASKEWFPCGFKGGKRGFPIDF
jgi:hypothetical protein